MKKLPKEKTAFGKVNEPDREDELNLATGSAAPDEVKKDAADEKKVLPAEEQTLRTDQHAETVPRHDE